MTDQVTATRAGSAVLEKEPASLVSLTLRVNGETRSLDIDQRGTLLDLLREQLALTGTKKGCDRGACGACTVHVDGKRVLSCLTLAATCEDRGVTTIEGTASDPGTGRIANATFGDYLVAVNADVPDMDVIFVGEPDRMNPIGVKGVGEVGLVGIAAAIANGVHHATGVRIRDLPITLDQLLTC